MPEPKKGRGRWRTPPVGRHEGWQDVLELTMTSVKVPWFKQLAALRKGSPKVTIPQELADSWTEVMAEAVRAFHEPDFGMMPAMDYVDATSDKDVGKRIRGYQEGYDLEYLRRAVGYSEEDFDLKSYDFSTLPLAIQRAVVSHWDRLHQEFLMAHEGLSYYPDVGYVWLFDNDGETVLVPHRDMDCGEMPEESGLIQAIEGPYGAQVDISLAEYAL